MEVSVHMLVLTVLAALLFSACSFDHCPCKEQEFCQQIRNETQFEVNTLRVRCCHELNSGYTDLS